MTYAELKEWAIREEIDYPWPNLLEFAIIEYLHDREKEVNLEVLAHDLDIGMGQAIHATAYLGNRGVIGGELA